MTVAFTQQAWQEYCEWQQDTMDAVEKINALIKAIQRNPFKGIGKPEPLKNELRGYWSRRITGEHRLVYAVEGKKGIDQKMTIIQCKFHY
ncbi:Txe/YoeB family addiction module toxin [Pontibacter sp. E15-1]|uniref:Txe/YoeB family addiction module toxin n=1 Tax=Pontibacter sp. E15-1 TaxID=2919918 RepID=UPI001F4F81EA|nr:Txe/YoeB family addiction module toxin [Pontibacter sp. E15-1]MCJ8167559.1 Txe/YoeB family addiction module toxin [Pontibacter sp. E15-1]